MCEAVIVPLCPALRMALRALTALLRAPQATALSSQSDQIRMLEYQRIHLGPVASPASPDSVTKSLSLALPPGMGDVNYGTRPAVAPGMAALPTNPSLHVGVAAPAPAFPEDTGRAG